MGFVMLWNRVSRRTRERERERKNRMHEQVEIGARSCRGFFRSERRSSPHPRFRGNTKHRHHVTDSNSPSLSHLHTILCFSKLHPSLFSFLSLDRNAACVEFAVTMNNKKFNSTFFLSKEGPPFQISWSDHRFFQSNRLDWKTRTRKKLSVNWHQYRKN